MQIGPLFIDAGEIDAALRLVTAMAAGMALGLNRDLSDKPTGMRTLGLVALGAALVALAGLQVDGMATDPDATSRVIQGVIQGVLTGIGFLGAGVVLRDRSAGRIRGLTTAALVWVTAAVGIACALASWALIALGVVLALFLLVVLHPLEKKLERHAARDQP